MSFIDVMFLNTVVGYKTETFMLVAPTICRFSANVYGLRGTSELVYCHVLVTGLTSLGVIITA